MTLPGGAGLSRGSGQVMISCDGRTGEQDVGVHDEEAAGMRHRGVRAAALARQQGSQQVHGVAHLHRRVRPPVPQVRHHLPPLRPPTSPGLACGARAVQGAA